VPAAAVRMHPDWLGSPQHFVGGLVLAFVAARVARRWVGQWWLVAALAIGATATAELLIELVEYPLLYADEPHPSAYYDTLADLADTMVGAVAGAALGLIGLRRQRA
jgi:uncharacterized membrane protein YjdF